MFEKAKTGYQSGRFLLEQLGAERILEPELRGTLAQLRKDLLIGIENPTAADTMSADVAIIAYRNLLRVQGWIGSICLTVERASIDVDRLTRFAWRVSALASPKDA